ncbi:related to SER33 3-phosphoglycerate dehydrogenase [Rhynchosporium graminicola]|uniref:Related to SER33 3-phosphoglycerate dehydrogenase n=1 Tax=Rhynchosporium graminicola TaxID=2792576 RepID=A0A1E1KU69_9HELO|nr:related to SER33 3-phosphoglycerate dehydrogenase [Rhynchosporium commune]
MAETPPLHIVRLDGIITPDPIFSPSFPHTYTSYPLVPFSSPSIITCLTTPKPANVAITTRVPITEETLQACPALNLIAVLAIGTDMIDLAACNGMMSLRKVVRMHGLTVNGNEWGKTGTLKDEFGELPGTCREEIVAIVGAGELGNRVASICRALGSKVHFAERKHSDTVRQGRISFVECLQTSTTIFLTLPLSPESLNLISTPEFALMREDAILINVARGGIVDEAALVQALEDKKIHAAATDVFVEELAMMENVLVRLANRWREEGSPFDGRLILSPHIAWWARSSIEKLGSTVGQNIEAWARGQPSNIVA